MNDEDEFGKSPLGVSSKQGKKPIVHRSIDSTNDEQEEEEGRGKRALSFAEASGSEQGKDESTFGEEDLYGDLYGAGDGGEQKEGVGILRLKVSRVGITGVFDRWMLLVLIGLLWVQLMSDIGVKDSMISRLEKSVVDLQEEVSGYIDVFDFDADWR